MGSPDGKVRQVRFIALGDCHGSNKWLSTVVLDYAPRQQVDRILQVGDFGYWEHDRTDKFIEKTNSKLEQVDVDLYFIDGNHDNRQYLLDHYDPQPDGWYQIQERIWYADRGHRWEWDGVTYLALGGAHSYDKKYRLEKEHAHHRPGFYWFPGETITDEDVVKCLAGGETDVLVSHDCPAGVTIPLDVWEAEHGGLDILPETDANRERLRTVVDYCRPELVIHGHWHRQIQDAIEHEDGFLTNVLGLSWDGSIHRHQSWAVLDLRSHGA